MGTQAALVVRTGEMASAGGTRDDWGSCGLCTALFQQQHQRVYV
jgi:hypothetical protein